MEMFSSFMDDMDDDIMSRYAKSESNLAYLPINRHFIEQNGLRFDISSINSCVIKDKLPKKVLDEYIDGKYFNDYPIAVSFLMRRDEYINMQRETISDGLYNILRFSRGMCNVFSQGHIVSVYGDSDTVTVIAGFSKEGEEFDD
jgi:hypothetical protein